MATSPRRTGPPEISNGPRRVAGRHCGSGRITPRPCSGLGTALTALKRPAEAVEPLRRAVELQPSFVVAINNLGIALRELGQTQEALVQFRRAVELEPSYAPAQTNLGQALLDLDQNEEALAHCQEAVRLDPSSAEMHDNLGNVLRALDRLDEAWTAYWEALRLNPDLPLANAHIGLFLQKRGHFAEALPWLRKAVGAGARQPRRSGNGSPTSTRKWTSPARRSPAGSAYWPWNRPALRPICRWVEPCRTKGDWRKPASIT